MRPIPLALFSLALSAALTGCLRDAPPPDPGKCAKAPAGRDVYTWGEVGIGTCLSGPADMRFFEQDGGTFLALTNANPYIDFSTGSFLVIDWDSIDFESDFNYMHELGAAALPLDDYLGGLGVIGSRSQALVTGRRSDNSSSRTGNDRLYVVDLADPLHPELDSAQPTMGMRDDPYPVVIDEPNGRAYVGNLSDHSVAVLDTTGPRLEKIDVAPGTVVGVDPFDDADASGSSGTIGAIEVVLPEKLRDDAWTLDWIDGTARIWVPTASDPLGTPGLQRYTDVGIGPVASGLGIEVDPADFGVEVRDATFVGLANPWLYFVDGTGSQIIRITNDGYDGLGPIGDWSPNTLDNELLAGPPGSWDEVLGGPALEVVDESIWMFYDGRSPGGAPSVGLSIALGQDLFENAAEPFLTGADQPGFSGFSDPTAWHDVSHDGVRVWVTAINDDRSTGIGLTETLDSGESWSPVELVFSEAGADLSHPVVRRSHGRFELWYTRDDGVEWSHAHAWSWDGRTWMDAQTLLVSDLPYDPAVEAPRLAVEDEITAAWGLGGRDSGELDVLLTAGTTFVDVEHGFSIRVASGEELDNDVVPDGRAEVGLRPGSTLDVGGIQTLYATIEDDSRTRIAVLQASGSTWVTRGSDLIPAGDGGNRAGVADPVVVANGAGYVMFYAATDGQGLTTIRRASSDDGLSWTPIQGAALVHDDDWDGTEQHPHSVRALSDGSIRLWYAGGNGGRLRIGSATANSPTAKLKAETGEFDPWRFEPGAPGGFDDGGVRDPVVYADDDGQVHLIYAGFDGINWSLGHALLEADGTFSRRLDPLSDRSLPSMPGEPQSFSALGAVSPVLLSRSGNELELLYAGLDGFTQRLGRAVGRPERQWPAIRFPTAGDSIDFTTDLGKIGNSVIELKQSTETFVSTGFGMSGITLDSDRGLLYVPSKLESYFYVVDVRDDSGGELNDANQLDVEGIVAVSSLGSLGFRDALVDAPRDRLYLTSRNPDGVVVIDLTQLVDDDTKDVDWSGAEAFLPLQDNKDDRGESTVAQIGGSGMALTDDGRFLIVTHHRGNGVAIFDLEQGAFGAEVSWLYGIGENPHLVRISPDGRHAVVANYVGEILDDSESSSTLAVIDLDPTSENFLEVVTWLGNR